MHQQLGEERGGWDRTGEMGEDGGNGQVVGREGACMVATIKLCEAA